MATPTKQIFTRLRDMFPPFRPSARVAKRQPGIVFDPERCTGCGLCVRVCEQQTDGCRDCGQHVRTSRIRILRDSTAGTSFAVLCQHCLDPLCLKACPNGAISKGKDGVVRMDKRLCVNCGLCIEACPECAPRRAADGNVVKCDLCGGEPACVEACPQGALSYTRGKRLHWIPFLRWPAQFLSFLLLVVFLVGSVCSLNIATLDLACPFGVLQNVFSAKTILGTTLASGVLLLVLAFALGRAFCGWMCPFGFLLDLVDKILVRTKHRLPAFLRNRLNKYAVGAGSLVAASAVGTQAFCTVCPIGGVCRSYGFNSVMSGAEAAVIPAIAALNFSEKRTWCRYFCPVGALFALAARFGLVRIDIGAQKCKKFSCMRCADVCPMGVIPKDQLVQGISPKLDMRECIVCLRCVDVCPHRAATVRFVWQKPRVPHASSVPASCPQAPSQAAPEQGGCNTEHRGGTA